MLVHQRAARTFAPDPRLFAKRQPNLERGHDVLRYSILKREHVVEVAFETVGPDMAAAQAVDQLCCQPHSIASLANASFQHIASAEQSPDFADVPRLSLEHKTRITGYDQQLLNLRQCGQHVFSDTVGEILLFRITAHVLERQHGNRWFVWQRQRLGKSRECYRARSIRQPASNVSPNRPLNVLDLLSTKV